MNPRMRFAAVAAVLAGAVVAVLAIAGPKTGQQAVRTTLPSAAKTPQLPAQCLQIPAAQTTPAWYPKDLPMPDGSFVNQVPAASAGLRRIIFTATGSLRDFVKHALTVWPQHGWKLGRGESEQGEAEDNFLKGTDRYGLFRAQSVYCDPSRTWVLLVLSDPSIAASPTPTPSPSPSRS